ncbi:MAG TPA: glycosyltransferase [Candidatus Binatia bacterium]|nr:glycosyltransferase [Candidatus Binatia bacterium]
MPSSSDLRVLYVTDGWDGSYRYRCKQAVEQLRLAGAAANVFNLADPGLLDALPSYGVVVLFRLPWSPRVAAVAAHGRRHGATLVFDIDDLLFDPSFEPLLLFLADLPTAARREYRQRMRALRQTFDACDHFVGSTPVLARHAAALGKPASVHPNVVSREYVRLARWLRRAHPWLDRTPTVAYISGSNTHDRDFETVAPALAAVLREEPTLRLMVCGFVELPECLLPFTDRIVRLAYQDWRVYPWALARCRVKLAPLAVVNDFSDAKSALKFFEAGIFGVPTIATPTAAYRDAILDGTNGLLAADAAAWTVQLRRVLDRTAAHRLGAAAHAAVLTHHSFAAVRGTLAALLAPLAGRAAGPPPPALSTDPDRRHARPRPAPGRAERLRRAFVLVRGGVPPEPSAPAGAALATPLDPEPFAAVLAAARNHSAATVSEELPVCRELSAESARWTFWRADGDAERLGDTRFASRGPDPRLLGPELHLCAGDHRYLLVRMAVHDAPTGAVAQLFWAGAASSEFIEARSVRWPVEVGGKPRDYVIDLWEAGWKAAETITSLRLDPLDAPGTIELDTLALFGDLAQLEPGGDPGAAVLERYLRGRGIACEPLHASLPADTVVELGHDLRADPRALPVLTGSVDFWVGSSDPDTLAEGVRVVRAGGFLAVAGERPSGHGELRLVEQVGGIAILRQRFGTVERAARPPAAPVDIVVPVHDAREATVACVESVLRHAVGDWRLVVVDDASTDAALREFLGRTAAAHPARVRLLRNKTNRGFVASANRGLGTAEGRDVLLLNSDTVVTAGFLERLAAAAYAAGQPAIVSPLSNNATICSVPEFCRDNPIPAGHTIDTFAALVAGASLRLYPELVSAHGFCMYIPRAILARVGSFDEERFGRGFGEENDFCERARQLGVPVRLADDAFVYHAGGASFGDAADTLKEANYATLRERHPAYFPRVARFVEQNPLAPVHASVRLALARRHVERPALLALLHASFDHPAGGTEHHVRDLVEAAALPRAVVAVPEHDGVRVTEVFDGRLDRAVRYRFALPEPPSRAASDRPDLLHALRVLVHLFGVGAVHMHQMQLWPLDTWRLLVALGIPYVATFQDYLCVCPNLNLYDVVDDRLCCAAPEGPPADPTACMQHLFAHLDLPVPPHPASFVARHRAAYGALLAHAHRVFFPAHATRDLVARFHPLDPKRALVVPHGYLEPSRRVQRRSTRPTLHLALLGEVAYPIKGAHNYPPLLARTRHLPVVWHVFGHAERLGFADALRGLGLGTRLVLHGWYPRQAIFERLAAAEIDLVVFLPPWPETFSYTLSEALAAGVPVVVSDQGALPERVRRDGVGLVVRTVDEAVAIIERLVTHREELERLQEAAARFRHRTVAEMAAVYRPIYEELLAASPAPAPLGIAARRAVVAAYRAAGAMAEPATVPLLPHYTRRWYRYYLRIAKLVPAAAREWGRRRVAERWWPTVRAYRFDEARDVTPNAALRLARRRRGRTVFEALGGDPGFVLEPAPFPTRDVRVIRFDMRCRRADGPRFAQLYWSHRADEEFSEDKSLRIPVDGADGRLHEYTAVIDQTERRGLWDAGEQIVRLRFDPVDGPAVFELGTLRLCTTAPSAEPGAEA